jgi:putative phosphoserine phosphatase/1-acylglycerol-3-phosphate O-acyltransferase
MTIARVRLILSFVVAFVGVIVLLLVAVPTLGLARRLYAEVIARYTGLAALRMVGIRVRRHGYVVPTRQTVFIANHPSTLDICILVGLGLPRTRFFMNRTTRKYPPLAVFGDLVQIIWTVDQEFAEERRRIFAGADALLRRTGDSVFLTPEGQRIAGGHIGHFNKGSFHLATSLGAQLVPMYLRIPPASDPGRGFDVRPGVVDVYFLPPIETSSWRIEDVELNRDRVRALYLRVNESMRSTGELPDDLTLPGSAAVVTERVEALVS